MGGAGRDQIRHLRIPAEELRVVTGDQATEAVPDDVDLMVPGAVAQPVPGLTDLPNTERVSTSPWTSNTGVPAVATR